MKLTPRDRSQGEFTIGSWSWGYLLELAGPIWPVMLERGRWHMLLGVDSRFRGKYPEILGDSGRSFRVRADEARQLARVARNWALIQQMLPESHRLSALVEPRDRPFPEKVRDDWPPLFLAFAEWAERSGGFTK